jgi:hypothetical protein
MESMREVEPIRAFREMTARVGCERLTNPNRYATVSIQARPARGLAQLR